MQPGCPTWGPEDNESPSPSLPGRSNSPGISLISPLYFLGCDSWGIGWTWPWTHCAQSFPAFVSLGFPLLQQNVCSTEHCWCVLHNFQCIYEYFYCVKHNNLKTHFNVSYLNFQNIWVASWYEQWLFKMLKYRIIYIIKIKVQRADTIKNKKHFGYEGWLKVEGFQGRSCAADYLWARAVATCL